MRVIATCIGLLLCSAAGGLGQAQAPAIRDSAGILVVTNTVPPRPATARRLASAPVLVLGAASNPEEEFGSVRVAIRLSDGSVLVADGKSTELKLFSAAGMFIRRIGRRGEGPGDFRSLGHVFGLSGDTILVWDGTLNRASRFTADGRLRGTLTVERIPLIPAPGGRRGGLLPVIRAVGVLTNGTLLGYHTGVRFNSPTGLYSDSMFVSHISSAGKVLPLARFVRGESYVFSEKASGIMSGDDRPFTTHASVAASANSLWYTDGVHFELREYALTGKLLRIVRIRRVPAPVTPTEIEAFRKGLVKEARTQPMRDTAFRSKVVSHTESVLKWLTFPKTHPAYTALLAARNGEIWARQHGDSTMPQRWDLFDASARFVGVVNVPLGVEVLEVGPDYLLGRARDSDDVETVRLYRFTK